MKLLTLALLISALSASAGGPAPANGTTGLIWDQPTPLTNVVVTNYVVYWGIGPTITNWDGTNVTCRCYTNSVSVGTNLTIAAITLLRGNVYYFAVTAQANGIESDYSNEVLTNVPAKANPPKKAATVPQAMRQTRHSRMLAYLTP